MYPSYQFPNETPLSRVAWYRSGILPKPNTLLRSSHTLRASEGLFSSPSSPQSSLSSRSYYGRVGQAAEYSAKENNKKGVLIFDFDGVLADSFNSFFLLIRDAMNGVNIALTESQYRDFFIGNVHQEFRNFIKDNKKYSAFLKFRKKKYNKYYKNVRLFAGASKTIKELSRSYILTVASSNKQGNILKLLKKNRIDKLFDAVLATTEYTKENMIKEILIKFKAKPKEAIMITDTVGDIQLAKKNSLRTVAVTWGFHSTKILKSSEPDFIADNFNELVNYLN